jgi:hypothetical protein
LGPSVQTKVERLAPVIEDVMGIWNSHADSNHAVYGASDPGWGPVASWIIVSPSDEDSCVVASGEHHEILSSLKSS